MKNLWIIAGVALLNISISQGASIKRKVSSAMPGAITQHSLNCNIPNKDGENMLGVGYSMTCDTQALAPQYSVRGCALSRYAVVPNAKPFPIVLKEKSQDSSRAEFDGAGLEVSLDKNDMKATVTFDDGSSMICAEK